MAVITKTITKVELSGNAWVCTWTGLATGDTGSPIEMPGGADRSVYIGGTFGGSTVTWEGSNDGTNYVTLADPQGNAISKTTAAIEGILEATRYMRPLVTGGAAVSVNVVLYVADKVG